MSNGHLDWYNAELKEIQEQIKEGNNPYRYIFARLEDIFYWTKHDADADKQIAGKVRDYISIADKLGLSLQ